MRSRYSAFVKRDTPYLQRTAAVQIRPRFMSPPDPLQWVGLKIISVTQGGILDQQGTVEFAAFLKDRGRLDVLHERSTFTREDGKWVYADGVLSPAGSPDPLSLLRRNEPCPCGSGVKYKKCCGL